jgi:hypothetical protein
MAAKKRTAPKKIYRWHVTQIRKKGAFHRIVEAPDETPAIREAIERWDIRDRWNQDRLIARREG